MNTAIIVGHQGQDGTFLSSFLLQKGYRVIGLGRNKWVENGLVIKESVSILDSGFVRQLLIETGPCEIYYLAAYHSSSEKNNISPTVGEVFAASQSIHVTGLLNFLVAITGVSPQSRLFYASSSLIFSGRHEKVQDESTPFDPVGIYGITKAQAIWLCREFRNTHNIFVSCGIPYNHESCLRPPNFLSSKIIRSAIDIANGKEIILEIGDLHARVDWGYAQDYVKAFHAILSLEQPEDFIIATGESHSVEEFLTEAFSFFCLDWHQYVRVNKSLLFRTQPEKIGNSAKLLCRTGISLARPFDLFIRQLINDYLMCSEYSASL